MSNIRKYIREITVFVMPALTMALLTGCQGLANTAVQTGQAEVMKEEEDLSPKQVLDLQSGVNAALSEETEVYQDSESEPQQGELSAADTKSGDTVRSEELEQEKTQPPEGWELKLDSEDWGLSFGESGTQPVGNATAGDLAWYDAYYVGDDSAQVIYLTFDCGYENGNTEPILDALKKHDVQATFFVVGHFLESAPDMAKRMVEDGHTVGNHTYHHLDMPTISDLETFQGEMDSVADLFREITGTELSMYYRPPQGKCNTENLKMAHELGYSTIFWSLAYVDWNQDDQPSHEEAFEKLTRRIHPGAIVLLHNTSQTNGEILDELLTRWEDMGYSFKPMSELINH